LQIRLDQHPLPQVNQLPPLLLLIRTVVNHKHILIVVVVRGGRLRYYHELVHAVVILGRRLHMLLGVQVNLVELQSVECEHRNGASCFNTVIADLLDSLRIYKGILWRSFLVFRVKFLYWF
jgi:hypothetical protein